MPGPVKDITLTIKSPHDTESIRSLVSQIRPEWVYDALHFKIFNEGISNTLFAIYNGAEITPDNCVLVRIFGEETELYIDRVNESLYLWLLSELGFASGVHTTFSNGICYSYFAGFTPDYEMLKKPIFYKMVAEKTAALHCLPIKEYAQEKLSGIGFAFDTNPCVLKTAKKFLSILPDCLSESNGSIGDSILTDERQRAYPKKEYLFEQVEFLANLLSSCKSPVHFCHNDMLFGNIVFSPDTKAVSFIDFEYCGFNHVCYEIANHFLEYAGTKEPDYSRYPSEDMQRTWLRSYLTTYRRISSNNIGNALNDTVTEDEIDDWINEIEVFSLASHLYWGIWSMAQSLRSRISFDYTGYALVRLGEYERKKKMLMPSTK